MLSSPALHPELGYASKVPSVFVIGSQDPQLAQLRQQHQGTVIGTHCDSFHCDEVLACTMLLYTDRFSSPLIVRTRDQSVLDTFDMQVDVGSVYDFSALRLDHHQKTFTDTWDNDNEKYKGIRLSSAGLVYKHFGKEVIKNACKSVWGQDLTEAQIDKTYNLLYKKLILEVDAIDNGVSEAADMRYMIQTGLAARIGRLNPDWNTPTDQNTQHAQFKKAMLIAEEELLFKLKDLTQSRLVAYEMVRTAWDNRLEFHASGEILKLDKFCPWKGSLNEIEKDLGQEGLIKFVIFESGGSFRISTVPPTPESFDMRIPLRKDWQGIREKELQLACGFDDAIFVHNTGFIGGAKTQATAVRMAELSMDACK